MSVLNRFCFLTEYYDSTASLVRQYQLYFYPDDNSIEMHDIKNKKVFLKRVVNKDITLKDLFLGSDISVFSRKLKIVEYGDTHTKSQLDSTRASTYGMIKPDAYLNIGKILDKLINEGGFTVSKLKMVRMSLADCQEFYQEHFGKIFYEPLIKQMSSDFIVAMELIQKDAVKAWRNFIGPTTISEARQKAPNSIRALYGTEGPKNAVHGSDSTNSAQRELGLIFGRGNRLNSVPYLNNCSCLVIKPHAIEHAGKIIDIILKEGFEISCMEMFYLDKTSAEEFFDVYKGVLPEYASIIEHVTTGPVIAMEIRQENAVSSLRGLVGPHDPEIARQLRPGTIRGMFGLDRVKNAVHCTDLTDDGVLEVQYFFELLQEK